MNSIFAIFLSTMFFFLVTILAVLGNNLKVSLTKSEIEITWRRAS